MNEDFLPLQGIDHVEFYVGNARQAAYYYRAAFGMELAAYRGPETGTRDRASFLVVLGFVLGVYLAERFRLGADHGAWASTRHAVRAVGLSILIELSAATLAAGIWVLAVATN